MLVNNLLPSLNTAALLNAVNKQDRDKPTVTLNRKLVVKDQNDCVFLDFDNITHLEAHGSYTKVFIVNEEPLVISKNMKSFIEKLNLNEFVRIHKSYVINLNHVSRYVRQSSSYVILSNEKEIPVAVRRKDVLDSLLGEILV